MTLAFVDTSFYVALANPRDSLHSAATSLSRSFRGSVLTTEYVLVELGNWLARSGDKPIFLAMMEQIREDRHATVIPSETSLFERGLKLFAERSDKNWSLTDCLSFVVMREHGIANALTADHHFEQAGFRILLRA